MLRQFAQFTVATALVSSACGAAEQDGPWAIYGHIVSTAGATEGWVVFDYSGISALYCSENDIPKNARKLRIFLHIGEGKASDSKCATEFCYLESRGFVRPGIVIIHGVALRSPEFTKMAANEMYLVWSPKSNFVLYGETADIEEALKAK